VNLSDPRVLQALELARSSGTALLAMKSGCRPDEIVAKDVQVVQYARRLESPDGQHVATIEVATLGVVSIVHGPDCACGLHRPAPAPGAPRTAPQADGGRD
jgi:hypothetical protein